MSSRSQGLVVIDIVKSVLMIDERELLIEDVNFKWLMAGLGCWVDMSQFHGDAAYAAHYLKLAEESDFLELRTRAATLKAARNESIE